MSSTIDCLPSAPRTFLAWDASMTMKRFHFRAARCILIKITNNAIFSFQSPLLEFPFLLDKPASQGASWPDDASWFSSARMQKIARPSKSGGVA